MEKGTLSHRASCSRNESPLCNTCTHPFPRTDPHAQLTYFCIAISIHFYMYVCMYNSRLLELRKCISPYIVLLGEKWSLNPFLSLDGWQMVVVPGVKAPGMVSFGFPRGPAPGGLRPPGAHPFRLRQPIAHTYSNSMTPRLFRWHLPHRPNLHSTVSQGANCNNKKTA